MAFNGRYYKGYMRHIREIKREEAEARNNPKPVEAKSVEIDYIVGDEG